MRLNQPLPTVSVFWRYSIRTVRPHQALASKVCVVHTLSDGVRLTELSWPEPLSSRRKTRVTLVRSEICRHCSVLWVRTKVSLVKIPTLLVGAGPLLRTLRA